METHLELRQAYTSQQVMILHEAGLVQDRRDSLNIFNRVVEPKFFEVLDAMQSVAKADRLAPPVFFNSGNREISLRLPEMYCRTECVGGTKSQ
jgi:hypothetical protein